MKREQKAREFLCALFGDKPERAAVQIWHRTDRSLTYFFDDLERAAENAVGGSHGTTGADDHDIYVACGLAPNALERPQRTRLKAHEIVGIPGVWADIDVNGGPDAKEGAAPSMDAALELASSLLEPTVLVGSGYGVQAWWLWEDGPWMFPQRHDAEQARRIVTGFQGALRASARRLGWGLDATQDLSRVLRVPGTLNHKGSKPAAVELLDDSGRRYNIEEIGELGQGFLVAQQEATSGDADVTIEIRSDVPLDPRLMTLLEEPDFARLWNRQRSPGRPRQGRDSSASGYELGICNWLVRAGFTPQAMADTIVYWRNKIEPGDPRHKIRRDRIAQTIAKVMRTVQVEETVKFIEDERADALETLEQMDHATDPPNEAKILGALNRTIMGPEIARLKQFSRDPQKARFAIELADGQEVPFGSFDSIASQPQFRKAYGVVTGHYPPSAKANDWDKIVRGWLKAAVVVDDDEDTRVGQMLTWIEEYFDSQGSDDRDGACISGGPFLDAEGDRACLTLTHFIRWLRRGLGERLDNADVTQVLRVVGFKRDKINYRKPDGGRSSRSYFVAARGLLSRPSAISEGAGDA